MDKRAKDKVDYSRNKRRSLAINLLLAREAIMSHFRPLLAGLDISEQQWRVVRILSEVSTLDASEVADKASILAPSLSRMIPPLEKRGFITKRKDQTDGRRTLLQITPAGRRFIDEAMPDSIAVYDRIDARFGAEKVELLINLLEELAQYDLSDQPLADAE